MASLLDHLGVRAGLRHLTMALVVLDPALYFYLFGYFYPVHELFYLMVLALAIHRYLENPTPARFALAGAVTCTLVYTRSLFHFSWALLLLAALMATGARRNRRARRNRQGLAWIGLGAATVLLAWPVKNQWLFGSFSYSSWQGYNLSQGLPVRHGDLGRMFSFQRTAEVEELRAGILSRVPERFRGIPVLSEPTKGGGIPNWNHYAILEYSRDLARQARVTLASHPGLLGRKIARFYRHNYTLPASREPRSGELWRRPHGRQVTLWQRAYEGLVFQFFSESSKGGPITGFAITFPLIVLGTAYRLSRGWKRDPAAAGTVAFLLYSILWVLALALCVDGFESNRMRLSTQPFVFICAAWAASTRLEELSASRAISGFLEP